MDDSEEDNSDFHSADESLGHGEAQSGDSDAEDEAEDSEDEVEVNGGEAQNNGAGSDDQDSDDEDGFMYHVRMQIAGRVDVDTVTARPTMITYDPSLPTTHAYLGDDLEDHSGRTVLDDDSFVSIPLMQMHGVILTPGQTVPFHIFNQRSIAMLRSVIANDRTFGMLYDCKLSSGEVFVTNMGTTAEIISSKDEDEAGIGTMRLKAIGRQRFKVIESHRQLDGILMGKVLILEEKEVTDPLEGVRLKSYRARRVPPSSPRTSGTGFVEDAATWRRKRRKMQFHEATLSSLPSFVYEMYDSAMLMFHIKCELRSWYEGSMRLDAVPANAVDFSYWVASKMPLEDKQRIGLLQVDSAVQRLRAELNLLKQCTVLRCKNCRTHIGNKSDVFSMSLDGPMAAYVNPGGYVHETLTLYKAQNLNLLGRPSTENSWFPGFAWTILQCRSCAHHMGWKFTAVKKKYKPQKFWGLTRSALQSSLQDNEMEHFVLQM